MSRIAVTNLKVSHFRSYKNVDIRTTELPIALFGSNGAGKTTLFRMIMEQEKADSGTFKVGETVKIAYVDQQHADIDMEKTIWEQITGGLEQVNVGGKLMNSRASVSYTHLTLPTIYSV